MQDVLEPANAQSVLNQASGNGDNRRSETGAVTTVAASSNNTSTGNDGNGDNARRVRRSIE